MKSTNYYPKVGTQITDLVWIESSLYLADSFHLVILDLKILRAIYRVARVIQ